ncbi:MAG: lipopolysaccharide heptosyltransferase II [Acidobacteria bacterium]|nr:lipopolysaccharide heptosyltransferase II [Acidobacteriota bacterium]
MAEIKRILVRGTNWLGDAVMTTPALRQLRTAFPSAHIALLVTPLTAGLFEGCSFVDEVLPYRRKEDGVAAFIKAVHDIRARKFDAALLFQNAFEAALLAWLGRVPLRIGYAMHGRAVLLTHRLQHDATHQGRHQVHDYLDIVERAAQLTGASFESDAMASLTASAAQRQAAQALLQGRSLTRRPLIALNTAATNSRAKCWPTENFAALADRWASERDAQIVLIGAASERENAAAVIAQMRTAQVVNLAGETSMSELIGLLATCDLLVSNDTGPAHVAAALGTPTLTLFGPTNEFETAPTGAYAELIRVDGIECARCMHRDCPIDHRCMTRLTVNDIYARSTAMLSPNE